jgi:hypothetical protein
VIALLLALLLGCGDDGGVHVPGSTLRVDPPRSSGEGKDELRLHVFHDEEGCAGAVGPENVSRCVPSVDRASGQVRLAFQLRVDGTPWAVPLTGEAIELFHKNQRVTKAGLKTWELVPHDPQRANQLFVLLIDASGSMAIDDEGAGRTRMDTLKAALLRNDVVSSFFPEDVKTAVVPLVFRGGTPEPLGGQWVVTDKRAYKQLIRDSLQVGSGYTYLYNAVDYATSTLLENPAIKQAVQNGSMQPTVVALTDGFNNESPSDACGDNAKRLERLLQRLEGVRRGETVDVRFRPTVYTVGLGRKAWRGFEVPDGTSVTARLLCRGQGGQRIDGGVELRGVDNAALSWIARVGGGNSFVSRTTAGLADAFKQAAAMRYKWFEARYQVDPFFLRRSFETKIRLVTLFRSEATIRFRPSGWLDAPPGTRDEKGWTQPVSWGSTVTVLLPAMGALLALGYLPAAFVNVKRALLLRLRRK